MHRRRKRRLVNFVRERQRWSASRRQASAAEMRHTEEVLDPNSLTLGFARRFATYKRATLLFRDVDRINAGKPHPRGPRRVFILFGGPPRAMGHSLTVTPRNRLGTEPRA